MIGLPIQALSEVFVGREDELATLTAALEAAFRGRGRLVNLVGEPGIGRRLDRLPDDCNRVLRVASAIGREFGLDLVRRLVGDLDHPRVKDAVEAALSPGLVEVVSGTSSRYRFTHILVQQTLSGELTTSERLILHGRIAVELEQLYCDGVELHAVELAYHLGEAAASDDETAVILFGLGKARAAALPLARMHEAVATLRRACEYYVATGDVDKAIEVALLPYYPAVGQPTRQTTLLVRALSLIPPGSKETARLLCRYGRLLAIEEGDVAAARSALRQALEIAEQSDDRALEFRVLADAADANQFDTASVQWLEKISRAGTAHFVSGRDQTRVSWRLVRARIGGRSAARRWQDRSRPRGRALDQRPHGQQPREPYPQQDVDRQPHRGGHVRPPA